MMRKVFYIFFFITAYSFAFGQNLHKRLHELAKSAPETENIDELLTHLKDGTKSKKELAKAIAYWMMLNISYDTEDLLDNVIEPASWEKTLTTRKAVCSGYSELYEEFCTRAGIFAVSINGYGKGASFSRNSKLERMNHSWNVIRLDDEYYLMDITWASGYIRWENGMLEFTRAANPEYLFSNPREFVERHLPIQRRWQLLEYPISFNNFTEFSSFGKMLDKTIEKYNYKDSINSFLAMNEIERRIKDVNEFVLVNPNDTDVPSYYEKVAYLLSRDVESKAKLKRARKFYILAEEKHREPRAKIRCKRGIAYIDHHLNKP